MRARVVVSGLSLASLLVSALACGPSAPPPSAAPTTWGGEVTPIVSVKELMRDVIDPLSDNIFLSMGIEVTKDSVREWAPRTDEDWAKVRTGAVAMMEVSHLLKVPRLLAPKGDENNSTGPDAPELSPAAIRGKIEKDPVLWQAKIEALRNVGREAWDIVERKDAAALTDTIEHLDEACESCHLEFWYPGQLERSRKLRELDRQAREEAALSRPVKGAGAQP